MGALVRGVLFHAILKAEDRAYEVENKVVYCLLTITLIPVILSIAMVLIMWRIQAGAIEETYGISGATVESFVEFYAGAVESNGKAISRTGRDGRSAFRRNGRRNIFRWF